MAVVDNPGNEERPKSKTEQKAEHCRQEIECWLAQARHGHLRNPSFVWTNDVM